MSAFDKSHIRQQKAVIACLVWYVAGACAAACFFAVWLVSFVVK